TKSSNYGASNTHTFDFAVLKASAGSSASNSDVSPTIPHPVTNAVLTIQNTNDGQNNTYPAYVCVGDDTLGAKNDTLTATLSTNPSLMYGFDGNVGNDTITGGGGADAIDGWAGADTIVYADKTDAGTWARGDWTPGSFVNCGSIDRITFESSDKIDLSAVIDGTFTFESAYTNIATALSSTQSGDTGYVVGYYDGTFFFDSAGTPNAVFLMFDVGGTDYAVLLTGVTSIAAGNLIL
ncbi:MAG: Peptidase serralysin terminal, partial [Pseudomonadota bacterium]